MGPPGHQHLAQASEGAARMEAAPVWGMCVPVHVCKCVCPLPPSGGRAPSKMHFIRSDNTINKYTLPIGVVRAVSRHRSSRSGGRWGRFCWAGASAQFGSECQAETLTPSLASHGLGNPTWDPHPAHGPRSPFQLSLGLLVPA